jgi:hypothetical protein
MIECPNHFGSFDCSPFCGVCQGAQEFTPAFPLAIEYECWTCSEWHSETSPSLSDLQEFLESSGARWRVA